MSRTRLTWEDSNFRSASSGLPEGEAANPAYKGQPGTDAYGMDSDFGSEPHSGPYENGGHPATPDEGSASPAAKAASLEIKAAKCIRIASAMLGDTASVVAIENQALTLMDLSDRAIHASLARLAGDDEEAEEEEAEEEEAKGKKASLTARIARLERVLIRLAEEEEADEEEADDEEAKKKKADSQDPGDHDDLVDADDEEASDDEEAKKKASRGGVLSRLARLERVLIRLAEEGEEADDEEADDEEAKKKASDDEEADDEEASDDEEAKKKASDDEEADDEEADDEEAKKKKADSQDPGDHDDLVDADDEEADDEEAKKKASEYMGEDLAMLEEMLREEGMLDDGVEWSPADQSQPASVTEIEMDPMGMMDETVDEDEMLVLANLFGKDAAEKDEDKAEKKDHDKGAIADDKDHIEKLEKDEDEDAEDLEKEEAKKKASLRPQPKRASKGATRLGGVQKEASSELGELSKLWESAPDVSKFF